MIRKRKTQSAKQLFYVLHFTLFANNKSMPKLIVINGTSIGPGRKPYVVAEIGVNHNGRLDLALKLIDAAAKAGADAVKFQTFQAEQVTTAKTKMAAYQVKNSGQKQSLLAMIKKLELKERHYPAIITRCRQRQVTFLSAPHGGFASVDLLQRLKVPAFKIGSADLTNWPLLRYAARLKKPMIISTGMATLAEIMDAVREIKRTGNHRIIVLHCTTEYPTKPDEVNLAVIPQLARKLRLPIGYSDHTLGGQVPVMAATLGACLIEKHFTLDRRLPGPDQQASTTPAEFREMVSQLKQVPTLMGSAVKQPTIRERAYRPLVRKSVVAAGDIARGEKFTKKNMAIKRPGTGLAPKYFDTLMGKIAKRDLAADQLISLLDLK